ncbi:hypothetical protein E2C01_019447 [Portunus trituberculatus]|uniref:Uncharacterized protein n=1 Tax=Portunus trituberculatus TaxID=210409 RepID=A0A5B7DX82_PORTR|nr:hypothetical protein [Portunus trituberculatus]
MTCSHGKTARQQQQQQQQQQQHSFLRLHCASHECRDRPAQCEAEPRYLTFHFAQAINQYPSTVQ